MRSATKRSSGRQALRTSDSAQIAASYSGLVFAGYLMLETLKGDGQTRPVTRSGPCRAAHAIRDQVAGVGTWQFAGSGHPVWSSKPGLVPSSRRRMAYVCSCCNPDFRWRPSSITRSAAA